MDFTTTLVAIFAISCKYRKEVNMSDFTPVVPVGTAFKDSVIGSRKVKRFVRNSQKSLKSDEAVISSKSRFESVKGFIKGLKRSKLAMSMAAGILVLGGATGSQMASVSAIDQQTKEIQGFVARVFEIETGTPNLGLALEDQIVEERLSKTTHWYDLPATKAAKKCTEWRMALDHLFSDFANKETSGGSETPAPTNVEPKLKELPPNNFLKFDPQVEFKNASFKDILKGAGTKAEHSFKNIRI